MPESLGPCAIHPAATAANSCRLCHVDPAVLNHAAQHPAAPPSDNFVRAEVLMGASIIQPVRPTPHISQATHADVKSQGRWEAETA